MTIVEDDEASDELEELEWTITASAREVEMTSATVAFLAEFDRVAAMTRETMDGAWTTAHIADFQRLLKDYPDDPSWMFLIAAWMWKHEWWTCAWIDLSDWMLYEVKRDVSLWLIDGVIRRRGALRAAISATRLRTTEWLRWRASELHRSGLTPDQIAGLLGFDPGDVVRALKDAGELSRRAR